MTGYRTALVTGAASGIGRALADLLDAQGFRLVLVDNDASGLESAASEFSAHFAFPADVADSSAFQLLADQVGAVDLLCLNAGVVSTSIGAPWESSAEEWQRVLGVNLSGIANGLRSFVPLMLGQETRSNILITASLAGAATWPGGGPYAVSKHAALALAEQAALELRGSNISVTVLCPALVRTAMSDQGEDPDEVAAEALRAVDDGRFAVIPVEWSAAVLDRARMLVAGDQPRLPKIGDTP